jgi:hypothetical protein
LIRDCLHSLSSNVRQVPNHQADSQTYNLSSLTPVHPISYIRIKSLITILTFYWSWKIL